MLFVCPAVVLQAMKAWDTPLSTFLSLCENGVVCIDVRSPAEYEHAHLPDALNLPLLNNEERHEVGLTYKSLGKEAATHTGFRLVGHKFAAYIEEARRLAPEKRVAVYCWRGGMRSNVMAWLLSTAGFDVHLLEGGYKAWRHEMLRLLDTPLHLTVLSGKTGVGKTEVLHKLRLAGEPVLDLEGLAHHRGSTYGALGMPAQPSQEAFENALANAIRKTGNECWVEDESRWIGKVKLPDRLYATLREAPIVELTAGVAYRTQRILSEYGVFPVEALAERTRLLERRLGGDRLHEALRALHERRLSDWVAVLFDYYDRTYAYGLGLRKDNRHAAVAISLDDTALISEIITLRNKISGELPNGK